MSLARDTAAKRSLDAVRSSIRAYIICSRTAGVEWCVASSVTNGGHFDLASAVETNLTLTG